MSGAAPPAGHDEQGMAGIAMAPRDASRYERIVRLAAEAIVEIDANGQILAANPAFAVLTGCRDVDEAMRRFSHIGDLAPGESWPAELMEGATGGSQRVVPAARADGTRVWAQVSVSPVHDEAGNLTGYDLLALDMTQRVSAELARADSSELLERRVEERTAELARAVKELQSFTYTVSHDLRAPLRAIEGFGAILVEDHGQELSDEAKRVVGIIRSSASRMSRLIDDLLHLTRLGRQTLRVRPLDVASMVQELADELRVGSTWDGEVRVHAPLPLHGDPILLRLALLNLLDNAFKFSAGADVPTVDVTMERQGDRVAVSVSDNGVGFDGTYAGQMFEVFQRLHPATQFPGTGVGLAIVKRVAERHGGEVFATSTGQGATIGFVLPASTMELADAS